MPVIPRGVGTTVVSPKDHYQRQVGNLGSSQSSSMRPEADELTSRGADNQQVTGCLGAVPFRISGSPL